MVNYNDLDVIVDAQGLPVSQYFSEEHGEFAVETTDGSLVLRSDVDFRLKRLILDSDGFPLPQLWDPELDKFVPRTKNNYGGGGSIGEGALEELKEDVGNSVYSKISVDIENQSSKLNERTGTFVNIYEYKKLVPNNKNLNRSVWDWTEAFKQASRDSVNNGVVIYLPREQFIVKDSFTVFPVKGNIFFKGNKSTILFDNTTTNKALLDLNPNSSSSVFEDINFRDKNKHTSNAVRISAYPMQGGYPNWKNRFIGCEFNDFKTAVHFTTNGDVLQGSLQDWSSENLFLHCKIKNCLLGVFNQNLQALNNSFIQTDIENDDPNELYTLIRDEAGGGMFFNSCSLIGRGRVYEWCIKSGGYGLFPNAHVNISNCRFEIRPNHIGELFYQDANGVYTSFNKLSINVTDCTFEVYGQTLDLIKYTGRVNGNFNNLNVNNGKLLVRNIPVQGISSVINKGSLGGVKVSSSTNISYTLDTENNSYGTNDSRFRSSVNIENISTSNGNYSNDNDWFHYLEAPDFQVSPHGLSYVSTKRLMYNDPIPTSGFTDVAMIIPKYARLMKFGFWKQPVRHHEPVGYRLYIAKDKRLWAESHFDFETDGILVADTGVTTNKSGLFEVPIQINENILGHDLAVGMSDLWTEGRVYAECYGNHSPQSGFIYIDYV